MEVADRNNDSKGTEANMAESKRKIGLRKEDVTMTISDRYTPPEFTKSVGKVKRKVGNVGRNQSVNRKGDQGIGNNDVALTIMNRFGPTSLENKTNGDEGGKENGRG
jgi:hypothetical protein